MAKAHARLVVVSNRLPFLITPEPGGRCAISPGSGGLVTAMLPVLRNRGGVWVGWPGAHDSVENLDAALAEAAPRAGYTLRPVLLTGEEVDNFYCGWSNEIIWPLFHDLQSLCNFDPAYWQVYRQVNRKYAAAIAEVCEAEDFVWVHDYQLMNVGAELRVLGARAKIAFFLHIPFPPMDIFLKLPWRFAILDALMQYDIIGFQTPRDRRNFLHCVRTLLPGAAVHGKGQVVTATVGDREVRVGTFPIGIDYLGFAHDAASRDVREKARELRGLHPDRQLLLGVDRLDYTKGIPDRLKAFRNALRRYPDLGERVTLIQVVVPSRSEIPAYDALKTEIEGLVGQINGEFTRPGEWVPIHYIFRSLDRTELLAYYRATAIGLVTPLKDGMNLVAKEYCACSVDEDCVLILSEFAGAAAQLQRGALLVNPHDIEGMADAIHRAVTMPPEERRSRMRRLRRTIRKHDVFWWVDSFLRAAIARDLSAFAPSADYLPQPVDVS
jgi:trehalose 6-phosphate synthase/phosphatase